MPSWLGLEALTSVLQQTLEALSLTVTEWCPTSSGGSGHSVAQGM